MPFSHRVFCRLLEAPSLSEVLIWVRQHGFGAKISGGRSANDLLSCYWDDVFLQTVAEDAALHLRCLRRQPSGLDPMYEEVADFVGDLREVPRSAASERVLEQLAATRSVLVVEFPLEGAWIRNEEMAASITDLFTERAQGLAQRDGLGFVDEDDEVVLALG